jgi:hypothetical protein
MAGAGGGCEAAKAFPPCTPVPSLPCTPAIVQTRLVSVCGGHPCSCRRLREGKASKAAAAAAAAAGKQKGRGGAAAVLQPGLLKWVKQLGVDDVTLANISWAKLVQPNKKGDSCAPFASCYIVGCLVAVL